MILLTPTSSSGRLGAFIGAGLLIAALFPGVVHAQACPLPGEYTNAQSVTVGDMVITLATAQSAYTQGDSITFRLSFENTGTTTQYIPNPNMIDPPLMIVLLPAFCDSVNETGCYLDGAWKYRYPGGWFFFGTPIAVAPGTCHIRTVTWDGVPQGGGTTPAGSYVAFGGGWDGSSYLLPAGGVQLPIQINAAPAIPTVSEWGAIILALLLVGSGAWYIRNRRSPVAG